MLQLRGQFPSQGINHGSIPCPVAILYGTCNIPEISIMDNINELTAITEDGIKLQDELGVDLFTLGEIWDSLIHGKSVRVVELSYDRKHAVVEVLDK